MLHLSYTHWKVRPTGLQMNCSKTEYMLVKDCEHEVVKSLNGNILKQVDYFNYLGLYISSSKKRFQNQKSTNLGCL